MSERGERKGACYSAVSVDIALVKSDAGKKAFQRGVAVLQQVFAIESATQFVDHTREKP